MKIKRKKSEQEVMIIKESQGVPYMTFPLLEDYPELRHGMSTRLGGVSKGVYSSMNLSFSRGDYAEDVRENFRIMANALGIPFESIVLQGLDHTVNVTKVTEADRGRGLLADKEPILHNDALITNEANVAIVATSADCVPLSFYDPVHHAIGVAHSGWKGTVNRMVWHTLDAMKREYGTEPGDVLLGIGPCVCQNCYEVSEDVACQFAEAFPNYENDILLNKGNGKYLLDLSKTNELVAREAGIIREHINATDVCTCCNPDVLFSHRVHGNNRGVQMTFLMLAK